MCTKDTYTITGAVVTPGNASILWTTTGKGQLTNETLLSPTYAASPLDGGRVTFTMTVSNSPCDQVFDTYQIYVYPTPEVYIDATTLCLGASTFVLPVDNGIWTSLAPDVASVNSATGVITTLKGGNATFRYTENGTGCTSVTSTLFVDAQCQEITLTEPAPLTAVMTGPVDGQIISCSGQPVPITVTFTGGTAPYTVTYTGDNIPHTTTNSSITFDVKETSTVTLSETNVSVTDAHTCASSTTGSYSIVVRPIPTASIDGGTEICQNFLGELLQWISIVNQRLQDAGERYTYLPFKLHQFISQTGSVYTTLDQDENRYITLEPGVYKKDEYEKKPIFPNVFSRASGTQRIS